MGAFPETKTRFVGNARKCGLINAIHKRGISGKWDIIDKIPIREIDTFDVGEDVRANAGATNNLNRAICIAGDSASRASEWIEHFVVSAATVDQIVATAWNDGIIAT